MGETHLAFTIMALVFGAFGLLFLGIGLFVVQRERNFIRTAHRAEGVVVGFERRRSRSRRRGRTYSDHPVVRYTTQAGWEAQFESPFATRPRSQREGERVPVLYNPNDPTDGRIATGGMIWGLPLVFIALGLLFAGFGLLFGALAWFGGGTASLS